MGEVIEVQVSKKILRVIEHYNECFAERERCLHCNDCIAYALIVSEALELKLPRGQPYSIGQGHAWNFIKFLGSTISREYLPCDRALSYEQIKDFAKSLLHLPLETRRQLRGCLICHVEFTEPNYTDGVHVCK